MRATSPCSGVGRRRNKQGQRCQCGTPPRRRHSTDECLRRRRRECCRSWRGRRLPKREPPRRKCYAGKYFALLIRPILRAYQAGVFQRGRPPPETRVKIFDVADSSGKAVRRRANEAVGQVRPKPGAPRLVRSAEQLYEDVVPRDLVVVRTQRKTCSKILGCAIAFPAVQEADFETAAFGYCLVLDQADSGGHALNSRRPVAVATSGLTNISFLSRQFVL